LFLLLAISSANFFQVTLSASENSHIHKGEKEKHKRNTIWRMKEREAMRV